MPSPEGIVKCKQQSFDAFLIGLIKPEVCLPFSPQLSIEQAQAVAEQVEMKAKVVQSEVKVVTTRHKKALEERECELLWKVGTYRFVVCTAGKCFSN